MDVPIEEIRYGLATHYHIDHAGAAQELKLAGVPLLVMENQVTAIPVMKIWTKPQDHYLDITTQDNTTISFTASRGLLEEMGIAGEILPTPGAGGCCEIVARAASIPGMGRLDRCQAE